jgi:hypothetical protein
VSRRFSLPQRWQRTDSGGVFAIVSGIVAVTDDAVVDVIGEARDCKVV